MSEEELNQELSTDELKDVAGGVKKPNKEITMEEVIITHVGVKDAGKGKRKTSLWGSGDDGYQDAGAGKALN
tara:strand:+ start:103 stop:318 length:216 start_codon:yes stop_codon:yes gene_type:complete